MDEYWDLIAARAVVSNPSSTAKELRTIAETQPTLWARIAAHPNTDKDLLDWLDDRGDAGVLRAVSERRWHDAKALMLEQATATTSMAALETTLETTPVAAPVSAPVPAPVLAADRPRGDVTIADEAPAAGEGREYAATRADDTKWFGPEVPTRRMKPTVLILVLTVLVVGCLAALFFATHWTISSMSVGFGPDSSQNVTMNVGDTLNGVVKRVPGFAMNDRYKFTSSDDTLLTIELNGSDISITALAPGEATIMGITAARSIQTTAHVTILQPVTDIDGLPASLDLVVGGGKQLNATVVPADATYPLQYSIDDTGVASIDPSGQITGQSVGSATLTVTAGDITKTIPVTVTEEIKWTIGKPTPIGDTHFSSPPWVADRTVTNCTGFSFTYSVTAVDPVAYQSDLANVTFAVMVFGPDKVWTQVGTFLVGDVGTTYSGQVTFPARDITQVTIVPASTAGRYRTWSESRTISDVQIG